MAAENTSPASAKSARCEASEVIDICNYRTEKIEAEGGKRPGLILVTQVRAGPVTRIAPLLALAFD